MSDEVLQAKIEGLKRRVREVQKYELMTTNQYRNQVSMIIDILEEIAQKI